MVSKWIPKIALKSLGFDKQSVAFDTKSNGNYKKSTRNHENIVMKSIAFDKKSVASYPKSNKNYRKSMRNQ